MFEFLHSCHHVAPPQKTLFIYPSFPHLFNSGFQRNLTGGEIYHRRSGAGGSKEVGEQGAHRESSKEVGEEGHKFGRRGRIYLDTVAIM